VFFCGLVYPCSSVAFFQRACGTGGAVVDGTVELQGDLRERIRSVLLEKGIAVKG
jgi:translation initiation factor 1 (eIF-1/SUI1)